MPDSDQPVPSSNHSDHDFGIDETIAVPLDKMLGATAPLVPSLGVIWHPDFTRIGDVAPLEAGNNRSTELSRNTPDFRNVDNSAKFSLLDRRVSRSPVTITDLGNGEFTITPPASKMLVMVNGRLVNEPTNVRLDELGSDIIITLSNTIILSLFMGPARPTKAKGVFGLLGVSAQIQSALQLIDRAGPTNFPVLIRGETGTGKELVAQAIHANSERAENELISVNMATLSSELGAADLFGAAKGAFTGAVRDRMGLFEQANEGSIFLDEIGETPSSVQAMLLRTLETGELRRVGETRIRHTGARVIAATDNALEAESFSQPLLRRLENISINMAPLRERRVDIGIMIVHFLKQQGNLALIETIAPWIANLVLYAWPGNVRELRNVVQQMAIDQVPEVIATPLETRLPAEKESRKPVVEKKHVYRAAADIDEEALIVALDENNWCIRDAAGALNISRTVLYSLIDKSPSIRRIDDVSKEEIIAVMEVLPDGLDDWAQSLRVSREALRRKVKKLGLE